MGFDLFIFDCDGTLVDSEEWHFEAIVSLWHELGNTSFTHREARGRCTGKVFIQHMREIANDAGIALPDDIAARYVERLRSVDPALCRPVEGVEAVLAEAARRGDVCLASNGEMENILLTLEIAGLARFFPRERLFNAAMVPHGKPAPDLFLYAAGQFNIDPVRCLVIEDSVPGVRAGKAAGMSVFGFTATTPEPEAHAEELLSAGADMVSGRLADLLGFSV